MSSKTQEINILDQKKEQPNETSIELELGDVIQIISPKNEKLNDQIFIIDYIDQSKVKLINTDNFSISTLKIDQDGTIGDGSIIELSILSRSDKKGYARQNNLLPGKWINIYFEGDIPVIITGEITNLEEDMIELRSTDGDVIYLNFDYKGIPEDLPIQNIEIREKPSLIEDIEKTKEDEDLDIPDKLEDLEREKIIVQPEIIQMVAPVEKVKEQLREFIVKANQIQFGNEEYGPISQFIDVSDKQQRFSIEQQVSDLLDDLLSTIPSSQRTERVLNNIHTTIERFKQLRDRFSLKDEYGNILGVSTVEATYKPLIEYFQKFNKNLYWILPVVKNIKKLYDTDTDENVVDYINLEFRENTKNLIEIINNYKSNNLNDDENKYVSLYKNVNSYFTPFDYINDEIQSDILTEKGINDNITTIIDNLTDFYSSVFSNNFVRSKRFVIQKYNLGMTKLDATSFTGNKMISTRVKLTDPDILSIKSILTLPEPAIRFSKINLPETNILERANLNSIFLNYWQLLKSNTHINNIFIDTLDNNIEYNENNFVNNIKNYILNLTDDSSHGLTKDQIYSKFIEIIVPKTKILFNLMKKYINGRLSIVDLVSYLEPFYIYTDNLTYMQYKEMVEFIDQKISENNKSFIQKSKLFVGLSNTIIRSNKSSNQVFQKIYTVISNITDKNNLRNQVFDTYDIDDSKNTPFSNSELLKNITLKDYGKLYNYAISLQNTPLIFPFSLTKILDSEKDNIKTNIDNDESSQNCNDIIIAKKYNSTQDLMNDNDIEIYFDKNLDTTNYKLMDNYEKEMSTKTPEEFIKFLTDDLKKKLVLSDQKAEELSESLIIGHKKVLDGHYAIIYKFTGNIENNFVYYVRKDNKWVLDETVSKNMSSTESDLLCNLREKCINVTSKKEKDDSCEGVSLNELEIQKDAINEIINEFDYRYQQSKEEYDKQIKELFDYNLNILPILSKIQFNQLLKYNNQKYKISTQDNDSITIVSPFQPLLNMILGQEDFVKKQNDILRFASQFTRQAYTQGVGPLGNTESQSWLYCVKTGTKLLPTFRHEMAAAWVKDPDGYNDFVDMLISKIGKKSDDGDWWTDESSGWQIKRIDFDVEEGYEGGFKVTSRSIMEKELGDTFITSKKQIIAETPETKIINNIINAVSFTMGINIENQKDLIINCVSQKIKEVVPDEPTYQVYARRMANQNKRVPSYSDLYNSSVLYNTIAMILIAIQVAVPSIKTRKTYPGCVRSFVGYPFEGNGDFSSLKYIACIVYDMRRASIEPWNVMKNKNENYIMEKIKASIDGSEKVPGLLAFPEVKRKMEEKTEYLLTTPLEDIPEEHNINNWTQFLPPLIPFKLKNLVNISQEFKDLLVKELKMGSPQQLNKIAVINSKIIQFSLAIQYAIRNIISKKSLLLKNSNNEPYLENSCCNNKGDEIAIEYFEKIDGNISQYNKIVTNLSMMLSDIEMYTKSIQFSSKINTKNKYPEITYEFSERTIYLGYIHYCKFKSLLAIPENLLPICSDKPVGLLNPNDSLTEIIKKLKDDGRNYSKENFLRMLQIISRNNIISLGLDNPQLSSLGLLVSNLEIIDDENDEIVEPALRKLIKNSLDTFEIATESLTKEVKQLNDYLIKNNENMKEDIIKFITDNRGTNQNITKKSIKYMTSFVNTLDKWYNDSEERSNTKISNDTTYKSINFYKLFIYNLINVFPNIILNKVDYDNINIPSYWGFSLNHAKKLRSSVSDYYKSLKTFYDDSSLINILTTIQKTSRNIERLAEVLPSFSTIEYNGKIMKPIFDERTSNYLFEHLLLRVLINYIDLTDDKDMLVKAVRKETEVADIFAMDYITDTETKMDIDVSTKIESDTLLLKGNLKDLRQKTAHLILVFMKIMEDHKDTINVSYNQIQDRIFKLKEVEKHRITDRLKGLSDEAKQVDNVLKINKLGDWSKGLQKGLTTYVKETYDDEREFMDKMEQAERNIKRKMKGIDEDNMDIYLSDYFEEQQVNNEIENDVNDMSHLLENYYDGNYDSIDAPEIEINDYEDYS